MSRRITMLNQYKDKATVAPKHTNITTKKLLVLDVIKYIIQN